MIRYRSKSRTYIDSSLDMASRWMFLSSDGGDIQDFASFHVAHPDGYPENVTEFMLDSKSKGAWRYQDCYHSKKEFFLLGPPSYDYGSYGFASGPQQAGTYVIENYPIEVALDPEHTLGFETDFDTDLSTVEKRERADRLFSNPRLPKQITITKDPFSTDFSIWFLLVDLYQMKGLAKSLFSQPAVFGRMAASKRTIGTRTLKQLGDDHLLVKFGIEPTIQDLQEFTRLISSWTKRYDDMDALLALRPWYSEPYDLSDEYFDRSQVGTFRVPCDGVQDTLFGVRRNVSYSVAKHFRTASYRFECPEFQGWLSRLKQFVDAFGILDPSAVWDLIPFSFIVDWFFGVGRWLHANRPKLFPADVVIQDYCESIKIEKRVLWLAEGWFYNSFNGLFYSSDLPLLEERESFYVRKRFLPSLGHISVARGTGVTSFRRALLSAALVAQRLPR